MNFRYLAILGITAIAGVSPVTAAPDAGPAIGPARAYPAPGQVSTFGSGKFHGKRVDYTATASETYIGNERGDAAASIFSVSYVQRKADATRPVTFLFGGGPGSAALWMHLGGLGPMRVMMAEGRKAGTPPPFPIGPSEDSLLDVSDLVFIDPVGTGFSHALPGHEAEEFYGVTQDAESIAAFIRTWINEHHRWNARKFIAGGSYGTTRAAALVNQLEGGTNRVSLNGVILLSAVLDWGATADTPGNEMRYVLNLPSFAAAALYHHKVAFQGTVEEFTRQARDYAIGPYASALLKGQDLAPAECASVAASLARFTGLPEPLIEKSDLRISSNIFFDELLGDRGETIGRLDTRSVAERSAARSAETAGDPSFYGVDGVYSAAINGYLRDTLKFVTDQTYITDGAVRSWDWRLSKSWSWNSGVGWDDEFYKNVVPYLTKGLLENKDLRVFVGQGYYDLATPFSAIEYSLSRSGVPRDKIEIRKYESGHMIFMDENSRSKLALDIRAFIASPANH